MNEVKIYSAKTLTKVQFYESPSKQDMFIDLSTLVDISAAERL